MANSLFGGTAKVWLCVLFSLCLSQVAAAAGQVAARQKGKASYYSRRAHGARTSSGERLNNDSLVCAHRTHPFGTRLLVKNPVNGKEVIVKVIDRGPYLRGRVIDLSYAAAKQLGILAAGVAMVEVSVWQDTRIPMRPAEDSAPELDIEITDGGGATPEWQRADDSPEQAAKQPTDHR